MLVKIIVSASLVLTFCLPVVTTAQGAQSILTSKIQDKTSPLEIRLSAWKFSAETASEIDLSADEIFPGESLRYQATYKNVTRQKLRNIAAAIPVPDNTVLIKVAETKNLFASIDSVNYQPWPLQREITDAAGQVKRVPVPLAEVRALRWEIADLAGGKSLEFNVDIKVIE